MKKVASIPDRQQKGENKHRQDAAGWIKIHRKVQKHWIWQDPVKFQWWIDILLTVNHEDKRVSLGMTVLESKRGQSVRSLSAWAKRWNVSRDTARRFLLLLKEQGMVDIANVQKTTQLTVCHYDDYQEGVRRSSNDLRTMSDTNKNEKNINITFSKEKVLIEKNELVDEGKAAAETASIHTRAKRIFLDRFSYETGESYYWTGKDGASMKNLLAALRFSLKNKGQKAEEEHLVFAFGRFLDDAVKDVWIRKNLSVAILYAKYNVVVATSQQRENEKNMQIGRTKEYGCL